MKRRTSLKNYFFAHKGNKYKPALFAIESVVAIGLVLILLEGAYLVQTKLVFRTGNFTASVLPAVVADLTNADRTAVGVNDLATDPLLTQAAQDKANDMAAKGYFAHVSPDGKTPWYWLDAVGYEYSYAGENLAVNFVDSTDVEQAWMNSPEHHANIVKPEYTKIGIGVSQGMYHGQEVTFVVELFAAPRDTVGSPSVSTPPIASVTSHTANPSVSVPPHTPNGSVLGASTPVPIPLPAALSAAPQLTDKLNRAIASPSHTFTFFLTSFIALILALLLLAFREHARMGIQYIEMFGGGFALIAIASGILFLNGQVTPHALVPTDGQAASVVVALE